MELHRFEFESVENHLQLKYNGVSGELEELRVSENDGSLASNLSLRYIPNKIRVWVTKYVLGFILLNDYS